MDKNTNIKNVVCFTMLKTGGHTSAKKTNLKMGIETSWIIYKRSVSLGVYIHTYIKVHICM